MNTLILISVCLILIFSDVFSFKLPSQRFAGPRMRLLMSSEEDESASFVPPSAAEEADRKLFDMNRRVRLGRSRDQDGKSNIWSVEPTMEVVDEDAGGLQKNLIIGALVIGTAIAALPLFSAFSTLFPDPSDF